MILLKLMCACPISWSKQFALDILYGFKSQLLAINEKLVRLRHYECSVQQPQFNQMVFLLTCCCFAQTIVEAMLFQSSMAPQTADYWQLKCRLLTIASKSLLDVFIPSFYYSIAFLNCLNWTYSY